MTSSVNLRSACWALCKALLASVLNQIVVALLWGCQRLNGWIGALTRDPHQGNLFDAPDRKGGGDV